MAKTYADKLKDPRWQKKRLEVLSRDEFTCQSCGDNENTLHVHHIKYNGPNPWDQEIKYLITLCEGCHETVEYNKKEFKELLDEIPVVLSYDHYADILEIVRSIIVMQHDPYTLFLLRKFINKPCNETLKKLKEVYNG